MRPFRASRLRAPHRPALLLALLTAVTLAGCGGSAAPTPKPGQIAAVGAESQYANVISQIGGKYVAVTPVESNPNTDPHTFEASPSVAQDVSGARLVVQNGLGYDSFMNKIESGSPSSSRKVIDVQHLLGLPSSTADPHLWYQPTAMLAVARAVSQHLSAIQPAHAAYFAANYQRFVQSLRPWLQLLGQLTAHNAHAPVAVTEPVGDYLVQAAGDNILTPSSLQTDVMNGVDPAPQDVSLQKGLLSGHRVKVLLYNRQVTDPLTQSFLSTARQAGIPVVGVYETMPSGQSYQSWMLAETRALQRALASGESTEQIK